MRPDGTVLNPEMPYSIFKSSTPEDLTAIYLFLRSLPPINRSMSPTRYSSAYASSRGAERGRLIYDGRCAPCHGPEGRGAQPTHVKLAEVAPSLVESDLKEFIQSGNPDLKMPGFAKTIRDDELADLVAHIRSWEKK